jgi:hypothetical protein
MERVMPPTLEFAKMEADFTKDRLIRDINQYISEVNEVNDYDSYERREIVLDIMRRAERDYNREYNEFFPMLHYVYESLMPQDIKPEDAQPIVGALNGVRNVFDKYESLIDKIKNLSYRY